MWKTILSITVLLLGLLYVHSPLTNQDRCEYGYYRNNGGCSVCPSNCQGCESDTKCTVCKREYYGQVCEKTCDKTCVETCHKVYGFCSFGCSDGNYSSNEDRTCRPCPDNCSVCSSATKCYQKKSQQCPTCPICDKNEWLIYLLGTLLAVSVIANAILLWRSKRQKDALNKPPELGTINATYLPGLDDVSGCVALGYKKTTA